MSLPLVSFIISAAILVPYLVVVVLYGDVQGAETELDLLTSLGWWSVPFWLSLYFFLTLAANYFSAAVIVGATKRFNGGAPTVRGSLAAAGRKIGPLALFSLLMATVGFLLQLLEDRVPFAGKIAVWLVDASWNIANFFAVPVIVLSNETVQPLTATKRSVGVIKKVWGEGIVAQVGIGIIGALTFFTYMAFSVALLILAGSLNAPDGVVIATLALMLGGLVVIGLLFSALGAVVKAALYQYATTGTPPEAFNAQLLQSAIHAKKAKKRRGLFGRLRG